MRKLFFILLLAPFFVNAQSVDGALKTLTASGTDTYTVTEPLPATYNAKERFLVRFTNANTGAATLNRSSLGAKSIVKADGSALSAGDIEAGGTYLLSYNGTNYQMVGDGGGGGGGGSPGGSDTQVQFNDGGSFGGDAGFVYNKTTNVGTIGGLNVSGLTASELVATDGSKNLQSLAVATYPSLTELSYVKGLTSAAQTQIDTKLNKAGDTYTTTSGDGLALTTSTLTSGDLVQLSSTGTAAASNTQTVLKVETSGANATSTQTTFAADFSNTHTGTSSTNYALKLNASGGTNNRSLWVQSGDVLISSTSQIQSTSGMTFYSPTTSGLPYTFNTIATGSSNLLTVSQTGTANVSSGVYRGLYLTGLNFAPSSGSVIFRGAHILSTINQTGTANGNVNGFTWEPTVTSFLGTQHNAFYGTSGDLRLDNGSIYASGNLTLGNTTGTQRIIDATGTASDVELRIRAKDTSGNPLTLYLNPSTNSLGYTDGTNLLDWVFGTGIVNMASANALHIESQAGDFTLETPNSDALKLQANASGELSFFNATPVVKQSAVNDAQELADALFNYGLLPASVLPAVKVSKVTVSGGANVRNIGSTQQEIIAAPGADKYINIQSVAYSFNYISATYDFAAGEIPIVEFSGATDGGFKMPLAVINGSTDRNGRMSVFNATSTDFDSIFQPTNTSVVLTTENSGNATVGDGDIQIIIYYTIEDSNN